MSGGGGGGGGRRRGGRGGGGGRASPAKSKSDRSAGLVGRPSRPRRFSEDDAASSELSTVGKRNAAVPARGEGVVGVIDTSNETDPPECGSRSSCDTPRARTAGGAADGSTSRSRSETPRASAAGGLEEEEGRTWSCSAAKSKPARRAGALDGRTCRAFSSALASPHNRRTVAPASLSVKRPSVATSATAPGEPVNNSANPSMIGAGLESFANPEFADKIRSRCFD